MPYIKSEEREKFNVVILACRQALQAGCTPGELNYLIFSLCREYLKSKGEKYTFHNDIMGVLESVKQEWYRRKTAPYEDQKIKDNGDIKNQ